MKVDTIQTSFVGGEFGASLLGRTDIAQYENACSILENFLIRPFGSAISTQGSEYISECKTGGSTGIVRLLNFTFSQTDAYVIEMGDKYFRFYTNGGVVVSTGTTPYEVAHVYSASEVFDVHFCQLNDVIYMAHPDYPPQKLTRVAAANWSVAAFPFTAGPYLDVNTNDAITLTPSGTSGTINVTVSPTNSNLFTVSGSTLGHKNSYWAIGSMVTDATTGLYVQGYVQLTNIVNTYTATATVIKTLASTAATSNWSEGAWSDVRGYPARVAFHEQRLFFARTSHEPQKIWGSKVFDYTNFGTNEGVSDDALNIQLASTESNDIKWLASSRALIAGTYGGEFTISSGDDSPLTPSNTNAKRQTSWGSEAIIPKIIGSYMYYVQRFSRKLRELFYSWDLDTYKSVDKTILSPEITGTGGIVDMAYQQSPDTILWCVCSNGTIATLTREVDQEVQGWSRQTTTGSYEAITTIPSYSQDYDEVWVVVNRSINGSSKRYVERFYSTEVPARQDQCVYLHSALTYNAYDTSSAGTINISLSATAGTIVVTSSASAFASTDVGKRIRAVTGSTATTIGEVKITGFTSATVVVGTVLTSFSTTAYSGGDWGLSVQTISGLDHLEACEVSVLADGGTDKPNKTVSGGSITLGYNYFVVNIGLPYRQKLQTLPQEKGSQRGTSQGKIQRISEVALKVNKSHRGFYIGGTEAFLDRVNFRDPSTLMGTPESLYTGTIPNISFRDDYQYGSRVLIHNIDPLPMEILSIITTIDTNDK